MLKELSEQVAKDVDVFGYYARPWVKPFKRSDGKRVYDVFIAGAGQNGAGLYFGLKLNGIHNVALIDENALHEEGNFYHYKRMNTLRTPKELVGMDFGIPNLTFRRFCEALYGEVWWKELSHVPREEWVAYLQWFREVLEVPVRNERELVSIEYTPEGYFALSVKGPEGGELFYARSVVLATGASGEMEKSYPSEFEIKASKNYWSHAADAIDFGALRGKRIAVLGHGAGAFDVAGYGLDRGVKEIHLCYRRQNIPRSNLHRHIEYAGMMSSFCELSKKDRWMINQTMAKRDQPPPQLAYDRVAENPDFHLYPNAQWELVEEVGDSLQITFAETMLKVDYAILATGFKRRPMERPEIAGFADQILTWENYQPPQGYEMDSFLKHPQTGKHFEYLPKVAGEAEWVRRIFNLSFGSALNMGPHLTSISGLNFSLRIAVEGIRKMLLMEDADTYVSEFLNYDESELTMHHHPGC